MEAMYKINVSQSHGLYPLYYDLETGVPSGSSYSFGAMSDSFYEYLFKDWRFKGGHHRWTTERALFDKVMKAANTTLLQRSSDGFVYIGDLENNILKNSMEHLACFLPGTMALASEGAENSTIQEWYLTTAEELAATCHASYESTASNLGQEKMLFTGNGIDVDPNRQFYWLRPESIESYFYLWRLTKNKKYSF